MGMIGNVIRVSQEELNSFLKNSSLLEDKIYAEETYEADWYLDLDKSWDGINYILTGQMLGDLENEPDKLQRAIFSGQLIDADQDLGYGPAHFLTSKQVRETQPELDKITDEVFKSRFNGPEMNELIYPQVWEEPESFEFLMDSFKDLKDFYRKAVENGEGIVTFIS